MADDSELSGLIRSWRNRMSPAAVGLPVGSRRTSGLRGEELALFAGLSVDYVIRLEQGRSVRPSVQVATSLARVLQLSETERDHFFAVAGLPAPQRSSAPTLIPGSVQRLLVRLPDVAVAVYTADWTLLTANAAWEALLGPHPAGFNLIIAQFTGTAPPVRTSAEYTAQFERALVSDLRAAMLRYPDARKVRDQLQENSRFTQVWNDAEIAEHHSEVKTFDHPIVGSVTVDCDVLTVPGTDLRIVTYTAALDTEDASRFDLIRTLGASVFGSISQRSTPIGSRQ